MKKIKKLKSTISLLLALCIVLSSCITGYTAVFADGGTTVAMSKSGIVGGSITSDRYSSNTFNIVNDGAANNTTVGLWSYDISDTENITSASLTAAVTRFSKQNIDGLSIDFYYLNPANVSTYLKDASASDKLTNIDGLTTNTGDSSVSYIKTTFGLSEKNLIGSLAHNYSADSNTEFNLDLTTAYHEMAKENWSGLCILAMCNKNNGASSSNPNWSDSWISLGNISYEKGSAKIDLNKSAVLTGGSGNARYNGNSFNIVNDGASTCTSVGLWSYQTANIKYVDSAYLNVYVTNYYKSVINDLSVDFYYIDSSKASSYLKELSATDKNATDNDLTTNVGDNSTTWIKNKFGLNDSNKIKSYAHDYSTSPSRYTVLDLTNALNTAKREKWDSVCILAMCNKNNNGTTSHIWSDAWVDVDGIYYTESTSFVPIDKTGLLCGENATTRYDGNTFNLVNDSLPGNTTVGLWSYDITDIKSGANASIAVNTVRQSQTKIDNFGIDFYWLDSAEVAGYLKGLNESAKITVYDVIAQNAGSGCVDSVKAALKLSDENKIGYLEHDYTDGKNQYYTLNLTSAVANAKQKSIENITVVAMCNRNNDGNTTKKWSDIWLELDGINYGADLTLAEVQPLKNAMAEYEKKMSSGKIYKNMGNAYTAYVNAQKAIDAYCYGNMSSLGIAQYTTALNTAVASMTEWSAPSANISPKFSSSDAGTIPVKTGCLWYEYKDDPFVKGYSAEGCNVTTNIYYQNGVYLYTDESPNIPFTVGFYRTSSSITASPQNPRVLYVSLLSQNGGLYIKNAQYQGDVSSREFATILGKNYRINATETADSNNIILSTGDMRYMADYFNINYQTAFSSNANYYVAAKPTGFKEGLGNKDSGNTVLNTKEITGIENGTFYVINYKPLLEKINSATNKNLLKNVASYKQGGLLSLMQAYDTATAINPSSYDYSSSTATKVINCATDIKNAVSKFSAVSSSTRDNANYNELRNALAQAKEVGNQNKVISTSGAQATRYTTESWNAYYSALTAAQNAMSDVLTSTGYSGTYDSKTVSELATAVTTTMNALKYNYIVEFISVAKQRMGSVVTQDGQTVDTSAIVNTQTVKGVQERQSHIVYYWEPITVTHEEYGDSEVITINEKSREEACELTLGDVVKEPTCDSPGIRQSTCEICGGVYQTETEKTSHNYTSEIVPATCTAKGYTLYTCANCGDTYKTDYTDETEHTYETVTVAPTCTQRGYTAKRCTVCSHEEVIDDSYTDALGHKYTYSVIREADCTFKGVGEYTCIRHDHSYTTIIEENPNNHPNLIYSRTVAPTATEEGYDIYYCDNLCGYWEKKNITSPIGADSVFADYLEAYNASLSTVTESFDAYTDTSKQAYLEAIEKAKSAAQSAIESKDSSALDTATKSIIEASALLRVKIITVRLLICNANGEIIEPSNSVTQASYGDAVTLNIQNEIGNMNVEKWTVKKNGVTRKVSQAEAECEIIADADATVNAYLTDEEPEQSSKIKLTVLNNDGRAIATKYVSSTESIDLTAKEIAGVSAPSIPFYTFKEWQVVKNSEKEFVMKATYEVI